jgi:hypothetical protein
MGPRQPLTALPEPRGWVAARADKKKSPYTGASRVYSAPLGWDGHRSRRFRTVEAAARELFFPLSGPLSFSHGPLTRSQDRLEGASGRGIELSWR